MTEIERVYDGELVEDNWKVWEESAERWRQGHTMTLMGQLVKARAAAEVRSEYGKATMEEWADHVGAGRSTVYALARGYKILLDEYETHERVSERLESSPLKISHVLQATYSEDVQGALDAAEDSSKTTRQMERERREKSIPDDVETITEMICPACGVVSPMNQVVTREVAR